MSEKFQRRVDRTFRSRNSIMKMSAVQIWIRTAFWLVPMKVMMRSDSLITLNVALIVAWSVAVFALGREYRRRVSGL